MRVRYKDRWYEAIQVSYDYNTGRWWYNIIDQPDTDPLHTEWVTNAAEEQPKTPTYWSENKELINQKEERKMVNVKELMVGDWVLHNGTAKKVITNLADSVALEDTDNGYGLTYERVRGEQMEPIPITEEILAKNFAITKHGYQVCDCWKIWANPNYGYILATLVTDEFGGGSYEPCLPCRYTHELQQFLRLKHEAKEVVV